MKTFLSAILAYVSAFVMPRHHLALEAVALRQQLAVYKRKQSHPKLRCSDRLFWVLLRQIWKNWPQALQILSSPGIGPDTACSGDGAHARSESEGRRYRKKPKT